MVLFQPLMNQHVDNMCPCHQQCLGGALCVTVNRSVWVSGWLSVPAGLCFASEWLIFRAGASWSQRRPLSLPLQPPQRKENRTLWSSSARVTHANSGAGRTLVVERMETTHIHVPDMELLILLENNCLVTYRILTIEWTLSYELSFWLW